MVRVRDPCNIRTLAASFQLKAGLRRRPGISHNAVNALYEAMERGRRNPWRPDELGVRSGRLMSHVIAFRATIVSTQARFKLGENERFDGLRESLAGVEQDGLSALAAAMRGAKANRLKPTVVSVSVNGSHESERETAST